MIRVELCSWSGYGTTIKAVDVTFVTHSRGLLKYDNLDPSRPQLINNCSKKTIHLLDQVSIKVTIPHP